MLNGSSEQMTNYFDEADDRNMTLKSTMDRWQFFVTQSRVMSIIWQRIRHTFLILGRIFLPAPNITAAPIGQFTNAANEYKDIINLEMPINKMKLLIENQ